MTSDVRVLPLALLASGALLAACNVATPGPAYNDCVTQIITAAADITVDLAHESVDDPALTCTVQTGADMGATLTLGRSRNVVQVVEADGDRRKQYAGTYFDCIDLITGRVLDVCLVVDGRDAGREMTLDADGDPALGPAVIR